MEIIVTDKYVSIESKSRNERFSISHIRKVNNYSIDRKYKNKKYDEIMAFSKGLMIFGAVSSVFGYAYGGGIGGVALVVGVGALFYGAYKKFINVPEKYKPYTLYFAEFISGENEIYGISSLSKDTINDFATKISEAMKGDLTGVYNFNIDRSINADTAIIENIQNDSAGTVNFYEGSDVRDALKGAEK